MTESQLSSQFSSHQTLHMSMDDEHRRQKSYDVLTTAVITPLTYDKISIQPCRPIVFVNLDEVPYSQTSMWDICEAPNTLCK